VEAIAPELIPYLAEPPQLPSGTPGKNGHLLLGFERQGERTILRKLERRVPLLVQQALYWDEAMPNLPCVAMISNAGGIVQGDRYTVEVELGPEAQAHVTTQAATKIHVMDHNYASQTQHVRVAEGGYLEFLPDPMIPHRHTRFLTRTTLTVAPTATVLYAEILAAGRKHHEGGELYQYDLFSSHVRGEREDGRELFVEKFVIEPARSPVRQVGVVGPYDVFANALLLTPREHADRVFEELPAMFEADTELASGASRLPNDAGLVYKILGMETEPVRAKLREFWSIVRTTVTGNGLMKEPAWR
jgi:urease accessory protein